NNNNNNISVEAIIKSFFNKSVLLLHILVGWPYITINHTLQNPKTPKVVTSKKIITPIIEKFSNNIVRSSHSIKNFIKIGKPLNIKIINQITIVKNVFFTDNPPKATKFLV
ncbi:MAG: hypothetical protein KC589_06060, partial [Nanoarchaeota archaeon]|nr:hypothetical protein [Nanoarchaeota archaeon]